MRSVVVVLPASMCAMIPMLRVFSSVTLRAMTCPEAFPVTSRKKALSGPGAALDARPEVLYVVGVSIDVNCRTALG
jgi:hypothetical protein